MTENIVSSIKIKKIKKNFTVCKVENMEKINFDDEYIFIGKTDEEISLVCLTEKAPEKTIEREDNWRGFRIQDILDFSLIGILSKISTLMADNEIGIFAISTFNTDYILVKEKNFEKSLEILEENGYQII